MTQQLARLFIALALFALASPAYAAFPSVAGSCASTDTVSDTSHTIGLDCGGSFGTISAGNLLIVCWNGSATDGTPNSAITGFTLLREAIFGSASGHAVCLYKIATGSEGTSVTGSTDLAERTSAIALRITGWHGTTPPEVSTGRNDASGGEAGNSPNPDAVTPSWGSADTLFIAYAGSDGVSTDFTVWPTNYGSNNVESANSGEGRSAVGTRALTATSDDPGVYTTINSTTRWGAMTIAVRPDPAAPPPTRPCCLGVF